MPLLKPAFIDIRTVLFESGETFVCLGRPSSGGVGVFPTLNRPGCPAESRTARRWWSRGESTPLRGAAGQPPA